MSRKGDLQLIGKIIVKGILVTKTGLRIGGSSGGLKIGGLDLNVITDPDDKPYIPGSSLKGKMRSLLEQVESNGKSEYYNDNYGKTHACKTEEAYKKCPVCKIWGTIRGGDFTIPTLTRLIVRDAFLRIKDDESQEFWKRIQDNIELTWTEVKMETAIDRINGSALRGSLRQIERVPAGATFNWVLSFNVFDESDKDLFKKVFEAMALLENDYLGGMGSRGYGQVAMKNIEVYWNSKADYENGTIEIEPNRKINADTQDTPANLIQNFATLKSKLS